MASPDGAAPPAPTEEQPKTPEELTAFVQSLLEQMQSRFTEMSTSIISRIDQMGDRIADLEASIGELMVQAGATGEGEGDAGDA